ncbi:ParB/RepB/Spo0J family partition protein [Ahrensia marina]|uniref:Chromosome partitioning protein ParB n=1 Tax=Ahrensia marina TaxID=1514904 RepID=A0A0N0VM45_9HYPH|nr:ParB/RepB/Spo0J family partition protein [Ahrensia marina]KPB02138.1 chromosome partitioning protein ParB [Ahrensia marina]
MADDNSRKRLGRGLAALIGEMDQPAESQSAQTIASDRLLPIELIVQSENNPRRFFSDSEIDELAHSIKEHGVIQPIVVRPVKTDSNGRHEIIAGERRWRASQRAGLTEVPVIIRDVDDKAALELAIIENVQRSDLNAIEEALGYQQLMDEHGYTQADLGDVIGKSRSHVANTLRLLKLPKGVQSMVSEGTLSAGHARTVVTASDPDSLAKRIVQEGLSVRQAEMLANDSGNGSKKPKSTATEQEKDADTLALEKMLSDTTGYRVEIAHKAKGGQVKISYKDLEQLDALCRLLQRQA